MLGHVVTRLRRGCQSFSVFIPESLCCLFPKPVPCFSAATVRLTAVFQTSAWDSCAALPLCHTSNKEHFLRWGPVSHSKGFLL